MGFEESGYIFSRDNVNLGWVNGDGTDVWDSRTGEFRGKLVTIGGNTYVLRDTFVVNPVPRSPRQTTPSVRLPDPPDNIRPISLPLGTKDGL